MLEDERERRRRARLRSMTWTVEPLSDMPPKAPDDFGERLEIMESLRRIGCELAGIPYPEGPTPKEQRRRWPVERIG